MITVSIKDILVAETVLTELGNYPFRGADLYNACKLTKLIREEASNFVETRDKICKKHGGVIKDDAYVFGDDETMVLVNEQLKEIINATVDFAVSPLSFEGLEGAGVTLMTAILWAVAPPLK